MKTFRHGLPADNLYDKVEAPQELDSLYEICSAEFSSDSQVHNQFNLLKHRHKKFDKLFARFLIPHVQSVARRDNLNRVSGMYPASLVASRISQDWGSLDKAEAKINGAK